MDGVKEKVKEFQLGEAGGLRLALYSSEHP